MKNPASGEARKFPFGNIKPDVRPLNIVSSSDQTKEVLLQRAMKVQIFGVTIFYVLLILFLYQNCISNTIGTTYLQPYCLSRTNLRTRLLSPWLRAVHTSHFRHRTEHLTRIRIMRALIRFWPDPRSAMCLFYETSFQ